MKSTSNNNNSQESSGNYGDNSIVDAREDEIIDVESIINSSNSEESSAKANNLKNYITFNEDNSKL